MQAYELFTAVKPSVVQDMFQWMRDTDRNLYKTALNSLASNRNLRLAFILEDSAVYFRQSQARSTKRETNYLLGTNLPTLILFTLQSLLF